MSIDCHGCSHLSRRSPPPASTPAVPAGTALPPTAAERMPMLGNRALPPPQHPCPRRRSIGLRPDSPHRDRAPRRAAPVESRSAMGMAAGITSRWTPTPQMERASRRRRTGPRRRHGPKAIELYHPTRAGLYVEVNVRGDGQAQTAAEGADSSRAGWDESGSSKSGAVFHGRAGYVRVRCACSSSGCRRYGRGHREPGARPHSGRPDRSPGRGQLDGRRRAAMTRAACSLANEAEAELGELVASPFRTKERTPLADPSGKAAAISPLGTESSSSPRCGNTEAWSSKRRAWSAAWCARSRISLASKETPSKDRGMMPSSTLRGDSAPQGRTLAGRPIPDVLNRCRRGDPARRAGAETAGRSPMKLSSPSLRIAPCCSGSS